jgi:hypothetical protein
MTIYTQFYALIVLIWLAIGFCAWHDTRPRKRKPHARYVKRRVKN